MLAMVLISEKTPSMAIGQARLVAMANLLQCLASTEAGAELTVSNSPALTEVETKKLDTRDMGLGVVVVGRAAIIARGLGLLAMLHRRQHLQQEIKAVAFGVAMDRRRNLRVLKELPTRTCL
jgi:hypothetical protein